MPNGSSTSILTEEVKEGVNSELEKSFIQGENEGEGCD
jgi:hypothetical protein